MPEAVAKNCGCSPLDRHQGFATNLNRLPQNAVISIHKCINGSGQLDVASKNIAKITLEGCIKNDTTIDAKTQDALIDLVKKNMDAIPQEEIDAWVSCFKSWISPPPLPPSASTSPAPSTPAPPIPCIVRCDNQPGDDSRMNLPPGPSNYRFVLASKQMAPRDELRVLPVPSGAEKMFVNRENVGASFSAPGGTQLHVCSTVFGSGGGCSWKCSEDNVGHRVTVSNPNARITATLDFSCAP